jgi:hypothetical protein
VNEEAARDVYANHRNGTSGSIGKFDLPDGHVERRAERIVANFPHPSLDGV